MDKEIWKDIKGYEGFYQISSFGNARSLTRTVDHNWMRSIELEGQALSPTTTEFGYLILGLSKKGKMRTIFVHRLVAMNFISNPDKKRSVNHKDGDKTNNNVDNLEWVTHSENMKHAYANGIRKAPYQGKKGKSHCRSKIVIQFSKEGKELNRFYGTLEAGRKTGVSAKSISAVALGKNKTAGGYKWIYEEDLKRDLK